MQMRGEGSSHLQGDSFLGAWLVDWEINSVELEEGLRVQETEQG